jgi:hypothetical protein
MKIYVMLLVACLASRIAVAQNTNISGTINAYSAVSAINGGNNALTLANAGAFSAGDLILIVQMKGATVDPLTTSSNVGAITALSIAGTHEFTTIQSIAGNVANLQYSLCNTYDPANVVQIVRVPTYVDATIVAPLTCQAWNGTDGGILVVFASGTVTFNADINWRLWLRKQYCICRCKCSVRWWRKR